MKNNEIETFIQFADIGLIQAVQTVCRMKYPRTVEAFDCLSESDIGAIRRGGLKMLPKLRLDEIAEAMKKDKFVFSAN